MEVLIFIIVVGALYFGIYKLAKSKNREPFNWILLSLLISPLILIIILACMQKLPKQRKHLSTKRKKRSKS
jgi:RsiW-degrading membrane proteinase PrsW (M82 family)